MAEMISETNKVTPPAPYLIKLVKKKMIYSKKEKKKEISNFLMGTTLVKLSKLKKIACL